MRRILLGLLIGACGCAARGPDPGQSAQPIQGGVRDSSHDSVFLLVEHASPFFGECTGTLIAPNLLLTAHHCVVGDVGGGKVTCGATNWGAPLPPSSFEATNVADPATGTGSVSYYGAQAVDVPPGGDGCGYDLALITLSDIVQPGVATPSVPRIDRRAEQGELYTAVGYGQNAAGTAGGDRYSLSARSVMCTPGSCSSAVAQSSEFLGGDGVCEGDSGSPALDADGKVFGVLSRGESPCASPIYGSVAAWSDWIIGVARTAAQSGGYPAPFWVSGQSDPTGAAGGSGTAGAGGGGASAGSAGASTGVQGSVCMAQADCNAGFHCFSPTGQATNAYCAADCATQACGGGLSCEPNNHVCLPATPAQSHDSGACALGVARGRSPQATWLLALLALGVWRRRSELRRLVTADRAR